MLKLQIETRINEVLESVLNFTVLLNEQAREKPGAKTMKKHDVNLLDFVKLLNILEAEYNLNLAYDEDILTPVGIRKLLIPTLKDDFGSEDSEQEMELLKLE